MEYSMKGLIFVFITVLVLGCDGGKTPPTGDGEKDKVELGSTGEEDKPVTLAQLIAGLPEDARPKESGDKVRISRANEWLAKSTVGKRVEDRHVFESVSLREGENKRYEVTLKSSINTSSPNLYNYLEIPGVPPDTLDRYARWPVQFSSNAKSLYGGLVMGQSDEALAQRLYDLSNKSVTVAGQVEGAAFFPGTALDEPPTLSIVISNAEIRAAPSTAPKPEPKPESEPEQKP